MMQAVQWVSPTPLERGEKKPKTQVALNMNYTVLTMWTFRVLKISRSQQHRHNCDCIQGSTADLTSPLVWTNGRQTLGILSLKCEYFPHGKRSVLGDKACGTVKSKTIPSPKHKHIIKIHKTGITAEWMKILRLRTDCPPGIHLPRQTACWHHFLGKGFKHFISHRKHLNYIITPYKNLLESFVIPSRHHLDCTSPGWSPRAVNWSFIARSAKGFPRHPWPWGVLPWRLPVGRSGF